jgi:hypothetical protein
MHKFILPLATILFIPILSLVAQEKGDAVKEDMAKIQGKWERAAKLGGNSVRQVKEHKGHQTTLTTYGENNEFLQQHKSEFKLRKTDDVRIFIYSKLEVTEGKNKGDKYADQFLLPIGLNATGSTNFGASSLATHLILV